MTIGHTVIGEGDEKVIVQHGWFGDYQVWEPVFSSLDKKKYSFVFIDYRGYGKSKDLSGDYSMSEIAQDTIALADELEFGRFHLIGHSMGGMAMQKTILDLEDTNRVKSAIGVDPVPACGGQLDEQSWDLFEGAI